MQIPWMVVKTSALGDVVQALDALGPLTHQFQQSNIALEWVSEPLIAPLIALHPLVSMVHIVSTKKWKKQWYQPHTWKEIRQTINRVQYSNYDVALDLQGNVKSALFMRALRSGKKIGFDRQSASEWPASLGLDVQLHTSHLKKARDVYQHGFEKAFETSQKKKPLLSPSLKPSELLWSEYPLSLESQSLEDYAIVALGSRWINKQPEKPMSLYLVRQLLENTSQTLYMAFGSSEEKQFAQEIVQEIHHPRLKLLFPVNLVEYAYIIYKAKWFVGADSLPLHLAGWFSTPSFSLFGPSSDFYYAPEGSCHASWQGSCPYNITFVKRCPRLRTCETGACLRQAPDKSIKESLEMWLNKMG